MKNLKQETIEALAEKGYTPKDVEFVMVTRYPMCEEEMPEEFEIDVESFWKEADQRYDEGYGTPEVSSSLKVVGKDWWLERAEYDGSEWWEFKQMPTKPKKTIEAKEEVFTEWHTLVR